MTLRGRLRIAAALAGALAPALALFGQAKAGALRVSPVSFELAPGQAAAALSLRNDGDGDMTVQVRLYRWTQTDAGDVLEPTHEMSASPPFSTLPAQQDQTVRLVRAGAAPAAGAETAYRLLVDELPPPNGAEGRNVTLLMRHSIPLFLEGQGVAHADVRWTVERVAEGLRVHAANQGGHHLRVAQLRVLDAAGKVLAERDGLVGYVLGAGAMSWTLAAGDAKAAPARITVETDHGRMDVTLPGAPA